jgi:hypothetical protein
MPTSSNQEASSANATASESPRPGTASDTVLTAAGPTHAHRNQRGCHRPSGNRPNSSGVRIPTTTPAATSSTWPTVDRVASAAPNPVADSTGSSTAVTATSRPPLRLRGSNSATAAASRSCAHASTVTARA